MGPTTLPRHLDSHIAPVATVRIEKHIAASGGMVQSVQRLATGSTVRRSNSGVVDIFSIRLEWHRGSPSLLYNAYRVFPGSIEAGAWR